MYAHLILQAVIGVVLVIPVVSVRFALIHFQSLKHVMVGIEFEPTPGVQKERGTDTNAVLGETDAPAQRVFVEIVPPPPVHLRCWSGLDLQWSTSVGTVVLP